MIDKDDQIARSKDQKLEVFSLNDTHNARHIPIPPKLTVEELAELLETSTLEIEKRLMASGIMASPNVIIDYKTAVSVGDKMGFKILQGYDRITLIDTVVPTATITPLYIMKTLSPYFVALADLQDCINHIRNCPSSEIRIFSLEQFSPINMTISGAPAAIQIIRELIVPWRRKHAVTMAHLHEQERRIGIEIASAEVLEKQARVKGVRTEALIRLEELRRRKLENEKLSIELHREKAQLAIDIVNKIDPNLSETDKIAHVVKLLPSLDTLVSSNLGLSDDYHDSGQY